MELSDERKDGVLAGSFRNRGKKYVLTLTSTSLSWRNEETQEQCGVVPLGELISAHPCDCCPKQKSKKKQCKQCTLLKYHLGETLVEVLTFHAMAIRIHFAVRHGKNRWKLATEVFYPGENVVLKVWLHAIHSALSEFNRPKNLLVFVNPYGGKQSGLKIYEHKVLPLLHLAGVDAYSVVTQRKNHAQEVIEDINISNFDGIVCVGGDGSFSEVLNSVLLKTQREKKVDVNVSYNTLASPLVPFGIIPAGSTNTAAYCTVGADDPISAALLIIMGDSIGVDVCSVYHQGNFLRFAVTFLSYGYFGDVILSSDKMRFLGPKRYEIAGIKTFLCRKKYTGDLQVKVSTNSDRISWEHERCRSGCCTCLKAPKSQSLDLIPSDSSEKMRWHTVSCKFMALSASIMSCACQRVPNGLSPSQHIGNGYCDVIVISAKSRTDYLKYLLQTTYNYKNPFDLDFVQVYRVNEFMFSPSVIEDKTPQTDCTGVQEGYQQFQNSVWNCDGEVMPEASIHVKVHCQLVNVFGRGQEDRVSQQSCTRCFGFCKKDLT